MPARRTPTSPAPARRNDRANRAAFDRWRIVPRMLRDVVAARPVGRAVRPPPRLARSCSPRSACSSSPTARPTSRSPAPRAPRRADGHLEPGVAADGGRAPRRSATARAGSSSTGARRTSWSRASSRAPRRAAARRSCVTLDTTIARLAHARPRPRLPAVPARQGDRAVHERPGVPAASTSRRARAAATRRRRSRRRRAAHAGPVDAQLSRRRSSRACARAARAPRSSASRRSTRGRR